MCQTCGGGGHGGQNCEIHLMFSRPRLQRGYRRTSWLPSLVVLGNYLCMSEVPPITCILHCTKIMANLSLPAGRLQCRLICLMIGWFWSKNRHYFNSNSLHYLVQRDWWTLKGKVASVHTSALLKWTNTWIIPASEKLNAFITSSLSFPQSGRHLVDSRNRLTHGRQCNRES